MSKSKKSVVKSNVVENWEGNIVRTRPVAEFKYKGSHRRPVRRTVVLTQVNRKIIGGYEIREGNVTCNIDEAQYKTFSRDEIIDMTRHAMSSEF